MTIKEFFEADFRGFEEIKIYKNNDNTDDNLITHSLHCTKTIIELYGHYEIKKIFGSLRSVGLLFCSYCLSG